MIAIGSTSEQISPQRRKGRRENFPFHLPLRGRQMKNNYSLRPLRPLRLCGEKMLLPIHYRIKE